VEAGKPMRVPHSTFTFASRLRTEETGCGRTVHRVAGVAA
jgi:hypothetical protein